MKRNLVLSFAALVFCILVPIAAQAQSSEITFYAGGFTGDDFISQPQILFGDPTHNTVFDNNVTGGFRYAYFFNSHIAVEGGVGFTPASIASSAFVDGGSSFRSVVGVNTYVFQGNLLAHLYRGPVIPYVTGGVGAVNFDFRPNEFVFYTPSETDFALNAGGGFKIPVNQTTAIRAEGRVFWMDPQFSAEGTIHFVEITGGVSILFDF
ncbi:porin family protein [bacterium]|nr:MAG: porin family protein [bacterium]